MNKEGYEKKEACGCGGCGSENSGCCQQETERKTPGVLVASAGCDCGSTHPEESSCCCGESAGGGCTCGDAAKEKEVQVEYLYLDLNSCDRCIGTDQVLDEVVRKLTPLLEMAGYAVHYSKVEIASAEMAESHQFVSSPTIRVNGRDIALAVQESQCGCCSDISGTDVDCRVFEYEGKSYEIPPKEMLTESIMAAVFAENTGCAKTDAYQLPENLKQFFTGKSKKCADGNCCG